MFNSSDGGEGQQSTVDSTQVGGALDFMRSAGVPDFTQPYDSQGGSFKPYYDGAGNQPQWQGYQTPIQSGDAQAKPLTVKGEDLSLLPDTRVMNPAASFGGAKTVPVMLRADAASNSQPAGDVSGAAGGGNDPGGGATQQAGGPVVSTPGSVGSNQPGAKVDPQAVAGSTQSGGGTPPPNAKAPDAKGTGAMPGDSVTGSPDAGWKTSNGEDGKSVKWQGPDGNKYEFRRATADDNANAASDNAKKGLYWSLYNPLGGDVPPPEMYGQNPNLTEGDWYLFKNGIQVPEIGGITEQRSWPTDDGSPPLSDLWGAWKEADIAHYPFTPPDQKQTPAPANPQQTPSAQQGQTPPGTPDAEPRFHDTQAVTDAYKNHLIDAATARSWIAKLSPAEAKQEVDKSYDDANKNNTGVMQNLKAHFLGATADDVLDDFGTKPEKNEASRSYGASPDLDNSWESKGGDVAGYLFAEISKAIALKKIEGMGKAGREIAEVGPKIQGYVKAYNEGYDESIKNQQERGMTPDVWRARKDAIANAMNSAGVDILGKLGENGIIGQTEKAISRSDIVQKIEKAMNESGIVQKVRSELPALVPKVSSLIKEGVHKGAEKVNDLAADALTKVESWFEYGPKPSEGGEATPTPRPSPTPVPSPIQQRPRYSPPQPGPAPHPTPRPTPVSQAFPPHLDWTQPATPDDTGMV